MRKLAAWKKLATAFWVSGLVLGLSFTSLAAAHVVNEDNAFEDIGFSSAKEEIVLLTGMNAIVYDHGATMYRPQDKLKKRELARWAAVFRGLTETGAAEETAAQAALAQGLVSSLDGNVTYGDVNQAFFERGTVPLPENAAVEDELTREQYAAWMGSLAYGPYHPQGNLFERGGFMEGPGGEMKVMRSEEGNHGFLLSINGETFELSGHPRVLNAPNDPSLWTGLILQSSWLTQGEEDGEQWLHILIFGEPQDFKSDPAAVYHATVQADPPGEDASGSSSVWLWIAFIAITALGAYAWIAVKRG